MGCHASKKPKQVLKNCMDNKSEENPGTQENPQYGNGNQLTVAIQDADHNLRDHQPSVETNQHEKPVDQNIFETKQISSQRKFLDTHENPIVKRRLMMQAKQASQQSSQQS